MNVINDVVKMAESRNFKYIDEVYISLMRSLPDLKYLEEFVHSLKKRKSYEPDPMWIVITRHFHIRKDQYLVSSVDGIDQNASATRILQRSK